MTELAITRHGEIRMSQRGIRKTDLEFLLVYGTEMGRDRVMLTKQDAAREIGKLKKQIAHFERLAGKVVVVSGKHLVTTYHQTTSARASGYRTKRSKSCYRNRQAYRY